MDDATAARVRRQARSDPEAARTLGGLDAVRRELARLGADDASAPEVPAAVTARIGAALRSAPPPAGHALPGARMGTLQRCALLAGLVAVAAAAVVGAVTLTRDPGPRFPSAPTASTITVTPPFPLSEAELRAAMSAQPDLGPLADPARRASCLVGLGYSPAQPLLGARPVGVAGRPGMLLLLPGGTAQQIRAVIVDPTCADTETGLVAETPLTRR